MCQYIITEDKGGFLMSFGIFIVLAFNFGLIYFFSGSVYDFVGIFVENYYRTITQKKSKHNMYAVLNLMQNIFVY